MSSSVTLATGVRNEIEEAASWYRERDRRLAARFVTAVDGALRRVAQWPDAGSPIEDVRSSHTIRRVPVGRFPYQLVYAHVDQAVFVLAVAHHHRRPGYWSARVLQ